MHEWIGPLGNLLPIRSMPPGVEATRPSRVSSRTALDGSVAAQVLPMSQREYSWTLSHADSDDIRHLYELYQGVHGAGPFWLYDALAAGRNMLGPSVATPGLSNRLGWNGDVTSPARGLLYAASGSADTDVLPVLAGQVYTGSVEAVTTPAQVQLEWTDADGGAVGSDASDAGTGRLTVSATAPEGASGVRLVLAPESATTFRRMQLTETDGPVEWFAGVGLPRVVVAELGETYQAAWKSSGVYRGDYAVRLVEVGSP